MFSPSCPVPVLVLVPALPVLFLSCSFLVLTGTVLTLAVSALALLPVLATATVWGEQNKNR